MRNGRPLSTGRRGRLAAALVAVVVGLSAPAAALAGARPYAWVQGSETLPQTGLELESWFSAAYNRSGSTIWDWWFGPVVGVTDHVEVALYAIFWQRIPPPPTDPMMMRAPTTLSLYDLRLQASWLLADRGAWPVDVRLRLEFNLPTHPNEAYGPYLTAILSRDVWRLNFTLNLAGWLEIDRAGVEPYYGAGFGTSIEVIRGYRVGAEVWGEAHGAFEDPRLYAGPSIGLGVGRIWASVNFGFGISDASAAYTGRIVLGILL